MDGIEKEVIWYEKFGKYPNIRITRDYTGRRYVIGDFSWNRMHPNSREYLEDQYEFQESWNTRQPHRYRSKLEYARIEVESWKGVPMVKES